MTRLAPLLCLLALLGGCNKNRKTPPQADPPGQPAVAPSGDTTTAPVPPAVAVLPKLPKGWVNFREPQGAFSVYLPARPRPVLEPGQKQENIRRPVPHGGALSAAYQSRADGLDCQIGVTIYSPELVDGIKAAQEKHGPLFSSPVSRRAATPWCGLPAYEETNGDPRQEEFSVQRHVWVGNRHYLCTLFGHPPGRPTAEERAAVFDSFTPER